jgi:hypothetical protein
MDMNNEDDNHGNNDFNEMENTLSIEDLVVLHNIDSSFTSIFNNQFKDFTNCIDLSDRASALISWSQSDCSSYY